MVRSLIVALLCLVCANALTAQTVQNTCVEVSAVAQVSPPQITFNWPVDATALGYTVYRRAIGAASWGSALTTLPAGAITWVDTGVALGQSFEYRFDKSGSPTGRGFCQAGIQVPAVHSRGKVILIVADNHATYLSTELARLIQDLIGDGWEVLRHDVAITATAVAIKALVVADYNADPANLKAVFVFGDVAVPYSGNSAWDGHADHQGAWPCDGFLGDVNGTFTDSTVNNTTPARVENDNIPGDGKYDQSQFPSTLELAVGRVDLANMPAFTAVERDLLKAYLNKNHDFRHKIISCQERAVIDDNFGYFSGEAFASSGWRNFAPMFGAANSAAGDYFTLQNTASGPGYLWSYGCGGGSYTSAGGVGSTTNFATSTNRNIFTMIFGSYHGDWDIANSFLRAPLCSGWTLTNAWAGRPGWSFHPMALGESIGYCARYSMNDTSPYNPSAARGCHMGLMGDPTLRMHVVAPASSPVATLGSTQVNLTWAASTDAVLGYHIYRAANANGPFSLVNTSAVSATSFGDTAPLAGMNYYMVRALNLQVAGSGSYYNLSQGVFASVNNTGLTPPPAPGSGNGNSGGGGGGCTSEDARGSFTLWATLALLAGAWRLRRRFVS